MAQKKKANPFLADGKTKKPAPTKPKFFHGVEVYYTGASNYKSGRITLKSPRFKESKSFTFDTFYNDIAEMATAIFKYNKWGLGGYAETAKGYIFFTSKFESVKQLKPL